MSGEKPGCKRPIFSSLNFPYPTLLPVGIAAWPYGCPKRSGNVGGWTKTFSAWMTRTIFSYTSSPADRGAFASSPLMSKQQILNHLG